MHHDCYPYRSNADTFCQIFDMANKIFFIGKAQLVPQKSWQAFQQNIILNDSNIYYIVMCTRTILYSMCYVCCTTSKKNVLNWNEIVSDASETYLVQCGVEASFPIKYNQTKWVTHDYNSIYFVLYVSGGWRWKKKLRNLRMFCSELYVGIIGNQ